MGAALEKDGFKVSRKKFSLGRCEARNFTWSLDMVRSTLVSLILMTMTSQAFGQTQAKSTFPKGTSGGRFQLVQISEYRRDQYLVDTQTGRVWVQVCSKSEGEQCVSSVFQEVPVEGLNGKAQVK